MASEGGKKLPYLSNELNISINLPSKKEQRENTSFLKKH